MALVPPASLSPEAVPEWLRDAQPLWEGTDPAVRDWALKYGNGHLEHYQSVVRLVRRAAESKAVSRVLDVGAVPGHLSVLLKQAGFQVDAVDLAPDRISPVFEETGVTAHRVDIESHRLPFDDEQFDLVLFCEVLEHLRLDPLRPIDEIQRVLTPHGALILSVPNITPLMRFRFLRGQDYQGDPIEELSKIRSIGHSGHFRYYSRREVEQILSHFGFSIAEVVTEGTLKKRDSRWDARVLRALAPGRMKARLYVSARKRPA